MKLLRTFILTYLITSILFLITISIIAYSFNYKMSMLNIALILYLITNIVFLFIFFKKNNTKFLKVDTIMDQLFAYQKELDEKEKRIEQELIKIGKYWLEVKTRKNYKNSPQKNNLSKKQ